MARLLGLIIILTILNSGQSYAQVDCNAPLIQTYKEFFGTFNADDSGEPKPPCGSYIFRDNWYRFIATDATMTITVNGTVVDPAFAIYDGKCPDNLVPIACSASRDCGKNFDPAITISNLVVGREYFIRVWPEVPPFAGIYYFSIRITDTSSQRFLAVEGSAQVGSPDDCAILTSGDNQTGCAWYDDIIMNNIEKWPSIDLKYTLNFGDQGANARDGMAFIMSTWLNQCGNGGYGLGAEGTNNSVIVEFDLWDDGTGVTDDIPEDHLTLFFNGDFTNPIVGPAPVPGLPDFADGNDHTFQFFWEPRTSVIEIYFDNILVLNTIANDPIAQCFGGYGFMPFRLLGWGFTGSSTGGSNNFSICYEPHYSNLAPQNETVVQNLCPGFSYTSPNGNVYSTAGTYTEPFIDAGGCEAVRTIRIFAIPQPKKTIDIFICTGESYEGYTDSGQYQYVKTGATCDTLITLNLTVLDFQINMIKSPDINCINDTAYITGFIPNMPVIPGFNPTITYTWGSTGSPIIAGQGTDNIKVISGGDYFLQINLSGESDGVSYNCTVTSAYITVNEDFELPVANIVPIGELSCTSTNMVLNGTLSAPSPLGFSWSTSDGHIVSSHLEDAINIDQPGKYLLTVKHPTSGCIDTISYNVTKLGFEATADIEKTSDINCLNDTVTLSTAITDTTIKHFNWTTDEGKIISDSLQESILITESGDYFLTLYDNQGCSTIITMSVLADQNTPSVNAGPDQLLNCNASAVTLTGSASTSNPSSGITWTDQDDTVLDQTNLNLSVNQDGMYFLTVLDSVNFCSAIDTVVVASNYHTPDLQSSGSQLITCLNTTVNLTPADLDPGSTTTYLWTTTDGNITGSLNTLNTTVDQTGTYTLTATDNASGCSDQISVSVTGSTDQPTADAGPDAALDCLNPFTSVSGSFSTNDPANIDLLWETIGGNITGPVDGTSINVSAPGLYIFHVTNNLNNCTASDTLSVEKNEDKPIVTFDPLLELTCLVDQITVTPTWTNAGTNPTLIWDTPDGNIISTGNNFEIVVDAPGIYDLTVTNEETGCVTTAGVVVIQNIEEPQGTIPEPDSITCLNKIIDLVFEPSVNGNYQYQWNTTNGSIISDDTDISIQANSTGTYTLEVTNLDNGCKAEFSNTIHSSTDLPLVDAGTANDLDCKTTELSLQATVDNIQNFDIAWSALNGGQIISGSQTLNPTIGAPGTYVIAINNPANGCEAFDTIVVNENITDPVFDNPQTELADCNGFNGSFSLSGVSNAAGNLLFTLNGLPVEPQSFLFDNLETGDYELIVEDENGCTSTYDFSIGKSDQAILTLPDTLVLLSGQPYSDLYPEFEFDTTNMQILGWTGANYINCASCVNPTLLPTYDAWLTFSTLSANGCLAEDRVFIRVRKLKGEYFVPNVFTPYDLNGINDYVTVYTDGLTITNVDEFRIYDRWGEEVFSRKNFPPNQPELGWDGRFNGQTFNPGVFVYFAKLVTKEGREYLVKGSITLLN